MIRRILACLSALALVISCLVGAAPDAVAHGRGATARPLIPMASDSGLTLSGTLTCSTITVHATHPDGDRSMLSVWDITGASISAGDQVILDSIIDYESSMMAWDDVIPGHQIMVSVNGREDGDSLQQILTVPACASRRR